MVDFATKLKDVELIPFMLSIYKDDEKLTLLHHALEFWEYRVRWPHGQVDPKPFPHYSTSNPLSYVPYPPMELIEKYQISDREMASSRHLRCPIIIKKVLMGLVTLDAEFPFEPQRYWFYIKNRIVWDEDLIFAFAANNCGYLLREMNVPLTDEQKSVLAICA